MRLPLRVHGVVPTDRTVHASITQPRLETGSDHERRGGTAALRTASDNLPASHRQPGLHRPNFLNANSYYHYYY